MIKISTHIHKAIPFLENEDIVAIPTETVYGLAANIYSDKALKKIFETKERPFINPLIVHISAIEDLNAIAQEIPEKAFILAKEFWPGSLTLVLKKKSTISDIVTGGKDTVAVRIPDHQLTLQLLDALDFPLAAPSANPFGSISPTSAEHVVTYFKTKIPMVLDGGKCKNGIESTIIGFENDEPILYRLGAIATEDIEKVVGKVRIKNDKNSEPIAPGMLDKHYAPKTKTILVNDVETEIKNHKNLKIGVLLFQNKISNTLVQTHEILSEKGNLKEATQNLYAAMHRLDQLKLDVIIAERFPENNLGKSINDRLTRAAKK